MRKFLLSIFIILFLVAPAWAETYYVTQAGLGDDGANLTYETAAPISDFNAGNVPFDALDDDTVYLCGVITTAVTVPDGGADSSHRVTVLGNHATYPCTLSAMATGITINAKNYVTVTGFTIDSTTVSAVTVNNSALGAILNNIAITTSCEDGLQISHNSTSVTVNTMSITGDFQNALRLGLATAHTFTATLNNITINGTGGVTADSFVLTQSAAGSTVTINTMTVSNLFATSQTANMANANGTLTFNGLNITGLNTDNCMLFKCSAGTTNYIYDSTFTASGDSALGLIAGALKVSRSKFYSCVDNFIDLTAAATYNIDNCLFYAMPSAKAGIKLGTAAVVGNITNCTFDDTTAGVAGDGYGISIANAACIGYVWNSNFTGLTKALIQSAGASSFYNNCVNNCTAGVVAAGGSLYLYSTPLTDSPAYTSLATNDYTLTATSPYKDSGLPNYYIQTNPTDLALTAMPKGGGYPIGCYEYNESGNIYGTIN